MALREGSGTAQAAQSVKAIVTGPGLDNVATAMVALGPGERIEVEGLEVRVRDAIPSGHKIALTDLAVGDDVVKYRETIGRATVPIHAGEHVHVHNVVSSRLPGPGTDPADA